jgi:hypothetical protein
MPTGYVSLLKASYGSTLISASKAVELGLVTPDGPSYYRLPGEVGLGWNTFTSTGLKYLARCFGGCTPISDYVCTYFGIGSDGTTANVTDTALIAPITLSNSKTYKEIDGITYDGSTAVIQFTIGSGDGNGYLIAETGLFAGDGTLLARKNGYNINKTSSFSPTLIWRINF